jgi:hypothetical protein
MEPSPYPCGIARIRQARGCRAHRKDGRPCRNYAITGGYVCRMHGGAAGQVRRKAGERVLEAQAYSILATWTASPAAQALRDRNAAAFDRPVIEALAARLA